MGVTTKPSGDNETFHLVPWLFLPSSAFEVTRDTARVPCPKNNESFCRFLRLGFSQTLQRVRLLAVDGSVSTRRRQRGANGGAKWYGSLRSIVDIRECYEVDDAF